MNAIKMGGVRQDREVHGCIEKHCLTKNLAFNSYVGLMHVTESTESTCCIKLCP